MIWLIALIAVEVIALVALIVLAVRWGGMPLKEVLTILGIALSIAAIAYISILIYGISESLS